MVITKQFKTDLRCGACVQSIRPLLDGAAGVDSWSADVTVPDKLLTVQGDITATAVDDLLKQKVYRVLGEVATAPPAVSPPSLAEPPVTYYPLLLILFFLLGGVGLLEVAAGSFDVMRAMGRFMAGFFLVFSFFKLLDVRAFAQAYAGYDVVAARWQPWGFIYPFVELLLGCAYLANVWPLATNAVTLVVMGVSTVGVLKSILAKRKIRCACLGTVFNLPMSTVTLVEDLLMVVMAATMIVLELVK